MDLKRVLMELGNRLVTERHFAPGVRTNEPGYTTVPIVEFTNWLNNTPDAQEILAELGVRWPTPKGTTYEPR